MELKLGQRYSAKPREGATIRDPLTKQDLPPEGGEIVLTEFHVRRFLDGDLALEPAPKRKETVPAPAAKDAFVKGAK